VAGVVLSRARVRALRNARLYEQLVYEGYTNDQATYALTNLY